MGTGVSNGRCSDAMTLLISDWLLHLEGGTIPPYRALQCLPFISKEVNHLCISVVFGYTPGLFNWRRGNHLHPARGRVRRLHIRLELFLH